MVRKKILLVEDDQELQLAIAIRLKASGFDVKYAKNSPAAISLARQEKPDLIVLGPGMPHGDIDEFERRLRAPSRPSPSVQDFFTSQAAARKMSRKKKARSTAGRP